MKYRHKLYSLLPVLGFLILVIIIYYPVFFQGYWAVNSSDAVQLHLPNNFIAAQAFRHGQIPFWNPNFNLGQPTIDGSTTIFHPFLIFYLIFNPWIANTLEVLLGLLLTCLGIWYFLRQQHFEIFSAAVGTVIYVLSGPVFFLHSYHLGFMAILLLPWCLWSFHQYDRTRHIKWLWISAILCVLAVQSLDIDTLAYLYFGFIIDRLICFPQNQRKSYLTIWAGVFLLTALSGLIVYLPLYEWLLHSSRAARSYTGILPPNFSNLFSAIITNQWLKNWPYDVFYFYFGPAVIWLALAGLVKFNRKTYVFRYFRYCLVIPVFYFILCFVQSFYPNILSSFDIWRCMFVFCLSLAMVSAIGVENILQSKPLQRWITFAIVLTVLILAALTINRGMYIRRVYATLLIASISMLITILLWAKKNRIFPVIGISFAIITTLLITAIHYGVGTFFCIRYHTEITENLPFYRMLGETSNGEKGHWRVSVFGCTYNLTSLVGLKTLPNYTPLYNQRFEDALCFDNLIMPTNVHPYWMNLKSSDAQALSIYGVKFLIINDYDLCAQAPWDNICSKWNNKGWIERKDFVWPKHRVWENTHYIGRAYLVSSRGEWRSGVKFMQDTSELVVLRANANDGDRIVLADLDYPGWQAYVDNKKVITETYHGCLRSVVLTRGIHTVRWEYTGQTQRLGLILFLIVFFALIVFLCLISISERKINIDSNK